MIGTVLKRVVPVGVMGAVFLGSFAGCDAYPKDKLPYPMACEKAEGEAIVGGFLDPFNTRTDENGQPLVDEDGNKVRTWDFRDPQRIFEETTYTVPFEAFPDLVLEASRWLVKTLPATDGGPTKSILIVQDVTADFNSDDKDEEEKLKAAFRKMKQSLLQSDVMRSHFIFLSDNDDEGKKALELATQGEPVAVYDPTNPAANNLGIAAYSPQLVYVVKATFGKFERPSEKMVNSYVDCSLDVVLSKPIANRDINATSVSNRYVFHPYQLIWISRDECVKLQRDYNAWVEAGKPKFGPWWAARYPDDHGM